MSNDANSRKEGSRARFAALAALAVLAGMGFASPAFADAGDRDLEVNAINPAPNFLGSPPAVAPAAKAHHMKPVHGMTAANGHVRAFARIRRE
ncbi:hypothetical protein LMIY3S_04425 [Labrys miyagiensis]